ncbi:MAG: class I SAM-dependent methyltransferase [Ignavibacteriaceae bacterium]
MNYNHTCNLCLSDDWKEIFKTRDYITESEKLFSLLRCNNCGLHITYPQPSPSEIAQYYPDEYFSYTNQSLKIPQGTIIRKLKRIFGDRYYYFPPPNMPIGKAFEIGCFNGSHLKALQLLGWEVSGIDINKNAIEFAKEKLGLNVHSGDFQQTDIPKNSFDLVQAMMVMEHLYDVRKALGKISSIVKTGGLFIFNVPNHRSFERKIFGRRWFAYDIPRHLFHYDVRSLSKFLEQSGFSIENVYYQKVPYTIIHSLHYIVKEKFGNSKLGKSIADWLSNDSRSAFVSFYHFSFLQSVFHTSGRMILHARKN